VSKNQPFLDLEKFDDSEEGLPFTRFLQAISRKRSKAIFDLLVSGFKETSNKQYYLEKVSKKIDSYIIKLSNECKQWPFFAEDLKEVQQDFNANYPVHLTYTNADSEPSKEEHKATRQVNAELSKTFPKLQWLGKTNVLLTLFYDLFNGQDGKEPLLNAQKNDVKQFLKNNFLDADGNPLSDATITTIFTPSKEDKRANKGDRIELKNIQRK
ncbi:MAG TPA: hypothetical protein VGG71_07590, partial [Chitinophagaceae bacterium]